MRALNRPMFNMGGPIKEGVMHGIREPYRGGGAALVGNPVYPQTGGREHHNIWLQAGNVAGRGIRAFSNIFGKRVPSVHTPIKQITTTGKNVYSKGYPGGQIQGTKFVKEGPEVTKQIFEPNIVGRYLGSSPEVAIAKKLYEGKGLITKPIKAMAKSPLLTAAGAIWAGDRWIWGDGKEVSDKDIAKITGHEPFDHSDKKKIKKAQDAFAEAQRDTRVKKYLDIMGYDQSRKDAVSKALIDASKIISDRGTLETKNITRDLINPIIQATSKRFDKPAQIREAVGLMSVKAAIQKDLEDPQVKKLRALQITDAEQKIAESESFEGGLRKFISDRKGAVDKPTLERIARLLANQHGDSFTVIEDVTAIPEGGTGIYMSGSDIYRVIDGNAQQIA